MGHLGNLRQEYQDLIGRLEAGPVGMPEPENEEARRGWQEILEILYTPEEAELASKLPVKPSGLKAIAARTQIPVEELEPRLGAMADKGLVMDIVHPETGKTRWLLSPPVVGFFEFTMMRVKDSIPKKRMAEALHAYCHGDPAFAEEVFGQETNIGRALVHEDTLADESLPEVLDWERATEVVKTARRISLSQCYCRHKQSHLGQACDAPQDICMSLNAGADFVIRREFGREATVEEALEVLQYGRDNGLVHLCDNVQNRPAWICSCCGCCCGQLSVINEFGLPAVNPSGYEPRHDDANCAGCSRCARACPIGAIAMQPQRVAAKPKNDLRPDVDYATCIGCGVCVGACKKDALHMHPREHRSQVPVSSLEKALRQALERGRLPHLIFDEGAGRGSRFLNRVLNALMALPPTQRVLASEQLQSRFIRSALARVPDPTG